MPWWWGGRPTDDNRSGLAVLLAVTRVVQPDPVVPIRPRRDRVREAGREGESGTTQTFQEEAQVKQAELDDATMT